MVLVDESSLFRCMIAGVLAVDPGVRLVASVDRGARALQILGQQPVNVILLDDRSAARDGLLLLSRIKADFADIRIILLRSPFDQSLVHSSLLGVPCNDDADMGIRALHSAASDSLRKPLVVGLLAPGEPLARDLLAKVHGVGRSAPVQRVSGPDSRPSSPDSSNQRPSSLPRPSAVFSLASDLRPPLPRSRPPIAPTALPVAAPTAPLPRSRPPAAPTALPVATPAAPLPRSRPPAAPSAFSTPASVAGPSGTPGPTVFSGIPPFRATRVQALAIGCSTGGPEALTTVIRDLPAACTLPIFVVQHMPPFFTTSFAAQLARDTRRTCREAQNGETVVPGVCYLAPGGFHLSVCFTLGRLTLKLDQGPEENFCRPSVDVLFRSVAACFGPSLLAAVLTGMGRDGVLGAQVITRRGGRVVVQDEASSVVWGMPGAVVQAGLASDILPLTQIGARLGELIAAPLPRFS